VVFFLLPAHRFPVKDIVQEKYVSRPEKMNGTERSMPLTPITVNTNKPLERGGKKITPTTGRTIVLVARVILKIIATNKKSEIKND
jgi:hypothetical protein